MKSGTYYLGLDMGTNSVGWAVTDSSYHILRAKGKDLWGIREFDEAATAVDRRSIRISRRRRQRETARIGLLKSWFADAVSTKDPNFFARLENSRYYLEDKDEQVRDKNAIFNDADFKDKNYFKAYPTIFHLRMKLIEDPSTSKDVRLVYLAVLNMFKHRGHFLDKGTESVLQMTDMACLYDVAAENVAAAQIPLKDNESVLLELPRCPEELKLQFQSVLTNRELSRKARREQLAALLCITSKQKQLLELLNGMCGLSMKLSTLFGEDITDENGSKIEISFANGSADEAMDKLSELLNDEFFTVLLSLRDIYTNAALQGILKGSTYLSEARIKIYDKHHHDLVLLKKLLKQHSMADYDAMFRSDEKGSYSAYVHSCNSKQVNIKNRNRPKRRGIKERTQEQFYAYVKKLIREYPESEEKSYILTEIEKENFMPKQLTSSNGVIPNQLHARELKAILKNAEQYLNFLKEKDASGLTVSERIQQLFSFTIPYYIGPVSENIGKEDYKGTGWAVRKASGRILPWNIKEKIDIEETRKGFVERLIRSCTYMNNEKVLPKSSLLYERFCVLNEINNIRVNGEKLDIKIKQAIYTELFEKGKKVRRKDIEKLLISEGILSQDNTAALSGIDIETNSSLSSWGKLKAVFGEHLKEDKYRSIAEDIIYLCTVYGDDKPELKRLLVEKYTSDLHSDRNVLNSKDIGRIAGCKFSDWGRFSAKFLMLEGTNKETGEVMPLIRALWETNDNLMELLSDRYTYMDELKEVQSRINRSLSEITIEDFDEMYFSAPVKRMVWQTFKVIQEIEKVMGAAPDRIFVEMARQEEKEKKRTVSRVDAFKALYKEIKDEDRNWLKFIEDREKDGSIRSKKMYLYLTQMGKCMYSGHELDLNELMTDKYDIDHIYPRSKVKDDNIANNLVLVEKAINNKKQDVYPIHADIRHKMTPYWKLLLEKKLITKEKYDRLTGSSGFTPEQLAGFIERQLVETRQGTKSVANLLQELMPESTKVVFAKAGNVSDFRHDNKLLKSRIVNDMHHAHDAYLNIVVGNVYYTKFTASARNFIRDYEGNKDAYRYHLGKMFERDVKRDGYTAWIAENDQETAANASIRTVRSMLSKPSPLLARMSYEGHGGIAEQTLYGKADVQKSKSPDAYIPLKTFDQRLCDTAKYGGFSSVSTAYFTLVEYTRKGKKVRSLEAVPVYLKDRIEKDDRILTDYLRKQIGDGKLRICCSKVKLKSLLKINGYGVYLTGKTGNQLIIRNAVQLLMHQEQVNYIKKLESEDSGGLTKEDNMKMYDLLIRKHAGKPFTNRPNPILDKLKAGRDKFSLLEMEMQKKTLKEILKTTAVGGSGADLRSIDASSNTGVTLTNKVISGNAEFKLIQQSVTGLYEHEIDLLKI